MDFTATKKEIKDLNKDAPKQAKKVDPFIENGSVMFEMVKQDMAEHRGIEPVRRNPIF